MAEKQPRPPKSDTPDPGDAVPPGVAPRTPPKPSPDDEKVREKLEELPRKQS